MSSSPGASFRSLYRLRRPKDFQKVFSSKQRSVDDLFLFLFEKNNREYARLGLAVPKKHIQRSIDRNRIKRVIRESFRHKKHHFTGLDIVVMVRKPVKNINRKQFDLVLDKHCKKINKCA
ncbi:MAG: ribonuclease P protein component [Proteobacteria bacterium]|nr:ribonuclease P protein component [Pseudomonadota bacterium]